MKNKTILFVLTAILIFGTALFGCGPGEREKTHEDRAGEHGKEGHEHSEEEGHIELSPEALKTLNIRTTPAGLRAIGDEIRTTAVIEPDRTKIAHVSPRIAGRVEEVKSSLGESVKKGQVLAEIDSTPVRWMLRVRGYSCGWARAAGSVHDLTSLAKRIGQRWLRGKRFALQLS